MGIDVLGRDGAVLLLNEAFPPGRLEAAVRASAHEWDAWDRLSPALTCLRQRGAVGHFDEDVDAHHQAIVRAIGVPAWFVFASTAADPYVAVSALDDGGKVRWRSTGSALRVLGKLKKDAALNMVPFPVETRPVFDFAELGWREASSGTGRKWKYLARPTVPPQTPPWEPKHARELLIAFAGRSEAAERIVVEALAPRTWAVHRLAPTATLVRVPGAVAPAGLTAKLRKKFGFTALACSLDLRAQRVTWETGALDLAMGTGMDQAGVAFDWQAILERAGKKWRLRAVRPDVLVGA